MTNCPGKCAANSPPPDPFEQSTRRGKGGLMPQSLRFKQKARTEVSLQKPLEQFRPMTIMSLKEVLTKTGRNPTTGIADSWWVRSEARISQMIDSGMDLNNALLSLGGEHLVRNLLEKLARVIRAKRVPHDLDEFQPPTHPQAWYPDSSEPDLRTVAFKASMPDEPIEEAFYFWPTVQSGKQNADRADVLAAARSWAALIVRMRHQSHGSN